MRFPATLRSARRAPLLQVLKSAAATIAAWLIAGWVLPGPLPVFAAIAALLVVQPSVNQSLSKAIERSAGVILGVIIAVLLTVVLGAQSWVVLAAVVVAMLAAWAMRASTGTGNQVAISAVLVLALGASNPDYAFDRIIETLIGAAIGFVINIAIVPPVLTAPARRDIGMLGRELAASLDRLAEALSANRSGPQLQELMLEARLLRPMKDAAEASLKDFRKDVLIELYNEAGQLVMAYKVYRCWPSVFQALPDLEGNTGAVAIQTLVLENEGWERDYSITEPTEPSFNVP